MCSCALCIINRLYVVGYERYTHKQTNKKGMLVGVHTAVFALGKHVPVFVFWFAVETEVVRVDLARQH